MFSPKVSIFERFEMFQLLYLSHPIPTPHPLPPPLTPHLPSLEWSWLFPDLGVVGFLIYAYVATSLVLEDNFSLVRECGCFACVQDIVIHSLWPCRKKVRTAAKKFGTKVIMKVVHVVTETDTAQKNQGHWRWKLQTVFSIIQPCKSTLGKGMGLHQKATKYRQNYPSLSSYHFICHILHTHV